MLLKNNSQKIIHVGSVMILPDETKPVDDSLSNAPAVTALISRRALSIAANSGKTETKGDAGKSDSKKPPVRTDKGGEIQP